MKYTRLFNSIATAKAATDLVSPNLTLVKDGNNLKLLSFSDDTIDSSLQITGSTLSDLTIDLTPQLIDLPYQILIANTTGEDYTDFNDITEEDG